MNRIIILATFFSFISIVHAEDVKGSKDPLGLKRYEGSEIVRYEERAFDEYVIPLGKLTKYDFTNKTFQYDKSEKKEGKLTRVTYRVPDAQRTSLEVFKNYETNFLAEGWSTLFSARGKPEYGLMYTRVYESLKDNDQLLTYNDQDGILLVSQKAESGLTAVLFVTRYEQGLTRGIKVEKGQPLVQLDVIESKKMDEKMVLVSSSEMAKSIQENGKIALYGIYFDFNQSQLQKESEPTLEQITKLLNEKSNMKILVVGHTDSIGGFETNKQLSQKRAESVIQALVSTYNISQTRLLPFGASYAAPLATNETEEGRAKNRRVEIVEFK